MARQAIFMMAGKNGGQLNYVWEIIIKKNLIYAQSTERIQIIKIVCIFVVDDYDNNTDPLYKLRQNKVKFGNKDITNYFFLKS